MSINPMHYEDLVSYPGEDILSASVLRAKENIPSNEVVDLIEGSMWYRWFNQDQLQQGTVSDYYQHRWYGCSDVLQHVR